MTTKELSQQQWFDELILELRLRNIRGTAIGDAVAAVETHCEESGETPQQAFGEPREYGRALAFPADQVNRDGAGGWSAVIVPVAAGMVAFSIVPGLVRALFHGTDMAFRWGELASLCVLAVVVGLTMSLLRPLLQNKLAGILFFGGAFTILTMLPILLPDTGLTMPMPVAGVVCLVCLAVSVVLMRRNRQRLDDPIVDPRTQRRSAVLSVLTDWLFVICSVGVGLICAIPLWFAGY